jgi:CRISPR-associated protein Csy2
MMKSLLILSHINVENANTISGLTYGFPAMSHFLGFTHALSRALQKKEALQLTGCAVICHEHRVHCHQPDSRGDSVFSLTRNPLTKEGKTAPIMEEGRMHMDVSLIIACDFDDYDLEGFQEIEDLTLWVKNQVYTQRLAGGMIVGVKAVNFEVLPDKEQDKNKVVKQAMRAALPGFLLVDRNDLLKKHFIELQKKSPDVELMDAWLDFVVLKYQATHEEDKDVAWERVPKPEEGWLVPITTGYKAISPLYEKGEVACTRDATIPFCFVEPIYSIGQWLSPHGIGDFKTFKTIFWHYCFEPDWYLCQNNYHTD